MKKGSSLRVAIKESLKMKNDAEAKKNDSKLNVQSIAKSSSTNKSSKKKTANADKGKRVALNPGNAEENLKLPEKVKTLIDPQTPLMEQMKKIHAVPPCECREIEIKQQLTCQFDTFLKVYES